MEGPRSATARPTSRKKQGVDLDFGVDTRLRAAAQKSRNESTCGCVCHGILGVATAVKLFMISDHVLEFALEPPSQAYIPIMLDSSC